MTNMHLSTTSNNLNWRNGIGNYNLVFCTEHELLVIILSLV